MNFYGMFNNQTVAVTSCVGSTITFSAPHGITNIIPGMTRLYITGAADSGSPANSCNNNFYIYSAPTSTTLTVALAATDFTSTGNTTNGGTITYADGTSSRCPKSTPPARSTIAQRLCSERAETFAAILCWQPRHLKTTIASAVRHSLAPVAAGLGPARGTAARFY